MDKSGHLARAGGTILDQTVRYAVNQKPAGSELDVFSAGYYKLTQRGPGVLHSWKDSFLYFVAYGRIAVKTAEGRFPLEAGDAYLAFPYHCHSITADGDSGSALCYISFSLRDGCPVLDECGLSASFPFAAARRPEQVFKLCIRTYRALADRRRDGNLRASAYLRLIFDQLAGNPGIVTHYQSRHSHLSANAIDHKLLEVISWMSQHCEKSISVQEMAERTGYTPDYFSKAFHKATGRKPLSYLRTIRLERAISLLYRPMSIKEIAQSVGYDDPLYFSRVFRRWTGCSPSEYRLQMRGAGRFEIVE